MSLSSEPREHLWFFTIAGRNYVLLDSNSQGEVILVTVDVRDKPRFTIVDEYTMETVRKITKVQDTTEYFITIRDMFKRAKLSEHRVFAPVRQPAPKIYLGVFPSTNTAQARMVAWVTAYLNGRVFDSKQLDHDNGLLSGRIVAVKGSAVVFNAYVGSKVERRTLRPEWLIDMMSGVILHAPLGAVL